MGGSSRKGVQFDVPAEGAHGPVPRKWEAIPLGQSIIRRLGNDITIAGVGVSVHRALEAATVLEEQGISCTVLDLRTVSPLDETALCASVSQTGRLLVVDEDYRQFGLSGELAAIVLAAGISVKYGRVCTDDTIPFNRELEDAMLPNKTRIVQEAVKLMTS
jgi:pyruvate dehydrogenase E1 component beta subunit